MTDKLHVVLCRDRHDSSSQQRLFQQLFDGLSGRGDVTVSLLPHLYDLPPDGKAIRHLRSLEGDLVVGCWLYPRAAFWVLDANDIHGRMGASVLVPDEELDDAVSAGNPGPSQRIIWCFDLRQFDDARPLLAEIDRIAAQRGEAARPLVEAAAGGNGHVDFDEPVHRRWYPVVDRDRCGNCLDCLNFCLFGVFGVDSEGHVFVESPDACKDGCPACSRICSQGAIMFPDHQNPGIAGDPAVPPGQFNVDLVQLFDAARPQDLAEAERARFLGKPAAPPPQSDPDGTPPDDLDGLVDGLDDAPL